MLDYAILIYALFLERQPHEYAQGAIALFVFGLALWPAIRSGFYPEGVDEDDQQ